jgi:hypothetical protein
VFYAAFSHHPPHPIRPPHINHHAIRLILYGIHAASSYTIPHTQLILYLISHLIRHILYPAHRSSHLKLQDDFIGEQGLAALALGKIEEVYEIEEAHEIAGRS